jgi:hypothetical protein
MSPFVETKKYYESLGDCEVVKLEHWNKFAKRRIDVWGADMLIRQGSLGMAVQCTDDTSHGKHVTKALGNPLVCNWLRMGLAFAVVSFGLRGKRGERKRRTLRETQIGMNGRGELVTLT